MKNKLPATSAPMARKIKLHIYAMLSCMAAIQMKVSGVFHMYPSLPWILSSLQFISLSHHTHPSCLSPVYSHPPSWRPQLQGCTSCMVPDLPGTLLSKCRTGVSALWLLILFLMELSRTYCLWNCFFSTGRQNPWDREWQLQSLLVHAAPTYNLLAKKLECRGSWHFFNMFYTRSKYNI